jgi:hypothetical protein
MSLEIKLDIAIDAGFAKHAKRDCKRQTKPDTVTGVFPVTWKAIQTGAEII